MSLAVCRTDLTRVRNIVVLEVVPRRALQKKIPVQQQPTQRYLVGSTLDDSRAVKRKRTSGHRGECDQLPDLESINLLQSRDSVKGD